jgi:hypothetical protein
MTKQKRRTEPVAGFRTTGRMTQCLETELVMKCGQPDPDAVRSVIREWIVPLLVRDFLAEQEALRGPISQLTQKPTTEPIGRKERG